MIESLFVLFRRIEIILINQKVIASEHYFAMFLIAPTGMVEDADYIAIAWLSEEVNDNAVASNPFERNRLMKQLI